MTIHLKWKMTLNCSYWIQIWPVLLNWAVRGPAEMLLKSIGSFSMEMAEINRCVFLQYYSQSGQNETHISETLEAWVLLCLNSWWGWTVGGVEHVYKERRENKKNPSASSMANPNPSPRRVTANIYRNKTGGKQNNKNKNKTYSKILKNEWVSKILQLCVIQL